jgi:hypothetical protein
MSKTFIVRPTRRRDAALEREPLLILDSCRRLSASTLLPDSISSRVPNWAVLVKARWSESYSEQPEKFDLIFQSWDKANKASELRDHSLCTT